MKIKTTKRYTRIFKALAFNNPAESENEFLSLQSHFDEKGNLVEELKYVEDGSVEERNVYTLENEKLISHVIEMPSEGTFEDFRYLRDDQGRLVKEQKFYGDDPGEATDYFYDEQSSVVSLLKYDADGEREQEEKFEYDKKELRKHFIYDNKGELISGSVFEYKDGKLSRKNDFNSKNELIAVTQYDYDDKGNLLSSITRDMNEKIIESHLIEMDERGNIIKKTIRDFHPRIYQYEFDENNRCITEEMLNPFGQLSARIVFEYDEAGMLISEINYNLDPHHSHHDSNKAHRFEYTFYED
ncbi:MAG: hypothetical protein LC117_01795 [Bacteroidia bacterium]|nr:hypothetical protein [Bacteroidia bacterium]MCZ2276648.1 hypothetical protein [Bacteroidia bacterium]